MILHPRLRSTQNEFIRPFVMETPPMNVNQADYSLVSTRDIYTPPEDLERAAFQPSTVNPASKLGNMQAPLIANPMGARPVATPTAPKPVPQNPPLGRVSVATSPVMPGGFPSPPPRRMSVASATG